MVSMSIESNEFIFVGNNLAVDFVNTELVESGSNVDLLRSAKDFLTWAVAAGFSTKKSAQTLAFEELVAFRQALRSVFLSCMDNNRASRERLGVINDMLRYHRDEKRLTLKDGGLSFESAQEHPTSEQLIGLIAYEAAMLLSSKQSLRLKHCSNPKCILIFLDVSKSNKRRWCSMDTCGNRSKVANHYSKSKEA